MNSWAHLEPDVCLPAQFYRRPGSGLETPEMRLCRAVLFDALHQMARWSGQPGPTARKLLQDDLDWVASDDRHGLFAFLNLCDVLKLDPSAVRRQIASGAVSVSRYGRERVIQGIDA